jgi:hypothetical protein
MATSNRPKVKADPLDMKIESLAVDLDALTMFYHACSGCPQDVFCCCARYDICINTLEMERVIAYLPQVAHYIPQLMTDDGYDNVFEEIGTDLFRIDTQDDDLCVFAYHEHRATRCALHRVALDMGLPVHALKPQACLLWPLALSETAPYILSVHVDAPQFTCNHPRPKQKSLHPSIHAIITTVFGQAFAHAVTQAVHQGLASVELVPQGNCAL